MENLVGVIGGTGLYRLDGLNEVEEITLDTPFGPPSSKILIGELSGVRVAFLSRHGQGHLILPSQVNYRANICALKALGARWCISVSAIGSLQEEITPGHIIIPDQFIDRTCGRENTFYGKGVVVHISFADPYCPVLSNIIYASADKACRTKGSRVHRGGTYVCMEGPAFSTRAESQMYRSWGAKVIGMTGLPEAKLAREAEIAYATLGLVTDYDCWRSSTADVDASDIMRVLARNIDLAKEIIRDTLASLQGAVPSDLAANALQHAIVTDRAKIPAHIKESLSPLLGRYIS